MQYFYSSVAWYRPVVIQIESSDEIRDTYCGHRC